MEREGQTLYLLQGPFAIVKKHSKETHGDRFWEKGYGYNEDSNWLVSLDNGNRLLLPTKGGNQTLWFSPGGNYLVYFDPDNGCHYYSYNLHTGKLTDISANVSEGQLGYIDPYLTAACSNFFCIQRISFFIDQSMSQQKLTGY